MTLNARADWFLYHVICLPLTAAQQLSETNLTSCDTHKSTPQGYQNNKPNWSVWSTERPPTICVHTGY